MNFPKNEVYFTKGERIGLYFILALLFTVIAGISAFRWSVQPNQADFHRELVWVDLTADSIQQNKSPETGNPSREAAEKQKFFSFDPNTTSLDSLLLLPIPHKIGYNIDKYRKKGGRFSSLKDLSKIYGIEEYLEELRPYADFQAETSGIQLAESPKPAAWPTSSADETRDTLAVEPRQASDAALPIILELNTANPYQLQLLKGIGPYYAERIVDRRRELGGFYSIDQLSALHIPSETIAQIRHQLTVDPTLIRKKNFNYIQKDSLAMLPGVSHQKASIALRYRENHFPLKGMDEVEKIRIFSREELQLMRYYLKFSD